jgi:hypothetical protein
MRKAINTYQLHKELQRLEGLGQLKESEVRTPTFKIKLKVFTALLELNDITSCTDLMASREDERIKEKRSGKSLEQRRLSEHAFRRIYSKIVAKTLKRMKGEDDSVAEVQREALELFGKQSTPKKCHRAMSFLLRYGLRRIEELEDKKINERNESKVVNPKSLRTPSAMMAANNVNNTRNQMTYRSSPQRQQQYQQQSNGRIEHVTGINDNPSNRNNSIDLSQSYIGDRSMEILNPKIEDPQTKIKNNFQQKLSPQQDLGLSFLDIASPSALISNNGRESNNTNNKTHPMYMRYMEQRVLQLERNIEMLNASLHAQSCVVDETEHVLLELRDELMKGRVKKANDGNINTAEYDGNALTYDRIDSLFGRVKAAQRQAGRSLMETAMNADTNNNARLAETGGVIRHPKSMSHINKK